MLHELTQNDYSKIGHMMGDETNLAARAVILGNSPGWIFVDNIEMPRSALVWAKGVEGFFLMGHAFNKAFDDSLSAFVEEVIKPRALSMGYTWFEVSGTHPEWNEVIESIFYRSGLQQWTQRVYIHHGKLVPDIRPIGDPTVRIAPLDQRLMESDIRNISSVEADLARYWDSLERFLEQGLGYAVIWRSTVISICYVSFRHQDEYEVSIKIYDPLMRDGLVRAAAVECVRHILSAKGLAYWDCTDTNVTACRTAESLGFVRAWDYDCYGFPL